MSRQLCSASCIDVEANPSWEEHDEPSVEAQEAQRPKANENSGKDQKQDAPFAPLA